MSGNTVIRATTPTSTGTASTEYRSAATASTGPRSAGSVPSNAPSSSHRPPRADRTASRAAKTGANTTATRSPLVALGRAARELGLQRAEFDLAVHLGRVRTVPDEGGGGRRVARAEIDRVQAQDGFPEALRARVTAVGTHQGASLMGVTTARFTRLARLGAIVPVKFSLNRYRAIVWLYLAEELRQFGTEEDNARLLEGRMHGGLLDQLAAGLDLRPRNWRGRQIGFLLRQAEDPWERAAVMASFLAHDEVAEIVHDPRERAHLSLLRPAQASHGAPDSPAAHLAARIMTADDPDEISWLRADLDQAVTEARTIRPAPGPAMPPEAPPRFVRALPPATAQRSGATADSGAATDARPKRPRGLTGWLSRRKP
ncbi:DUF6397 family protein [Streptomyces sp. NPDC008313]|uniref:DUF6397 family protein n=1 Tax=Streptomyces sp. NPDC008313 TaxID=3364826 RepID=UPI0036E3BA39